MELDLNSANRPGIKDWFQRHGSALAVFCLFVAGLVILYRILHQVNIHDVHAQLKALPPSRVQLAVLFTALGYASLVGYDWSALRYLGKKLPFLGIVYTSFIGFSLSNSIGVSWLSGGAIRYRMYSRVGLSAKEITLIVAFCTLGFGLGEILVGGGAIVAYPELFSGFFHLPPQLTRWAAAALLTVLAMALYLRSRHQGTLRLGNRAVQLPAAGILAGQVLFSIMDIGFAGATLYVLLPADGVPFFGFLAIFAIALVAGVLSHVPGGLGVFEVVMATALRQYVPLEMLSAALICFRAVYYFLPFVIGILLLVGTESYISLKSRWQPGVKTLESNVALVTRVAQSALPPALAGVTFLAGAILLMGSSVPLAEKSLLQLEDLLPIELLELSHILGGVTGILLILLSYSLWQRVRAALWLSGFLFLVGAGLSWLQTLDYDRAGFMLLILVVMLSGRKKFYRRARLFANRLDPQWVLITLAALGGFLWLLFFSYKATPYQDDLWWKFAFDAQAPRGIRTAVFAVATFLLFYTVSALRPPRQALRTPDPTSLDLANNIIHEQDEPDACLALTGDKDFFFSDNGKAFIMFRRHRRNWVALGDPIGPSEEDRVELIWKFRSAASREQAHAIFYQASRDHMDWYVDAGFLLFKLGEEAIVPLPDFSLQGSSRSKLRQSMNRAKRAGLSFEMVTPPHAPELMAELASISNQWLDLKKTREKSFSLGRFNTEYLQRCPLALVRQKGSLTAFANLFVTRTKHRGSIDLMRHLPEADNSTMDFLFISLLEALRDEGYAEFSLGMAPMSGLMNRPEARLWDRFGNLVYQKGTPFYNFQGLRSFKKKFNPVWVPRYLATTKAGTKPIRIIVDIAALTGDGVRGVLKK